MPSIATNQPTNQPAEENSLGFKLVSGNTRWIGISSMGRETETEIETERKNYEPTVVHKYLTISDIYIYIYIERREILNNEWCNSIGMKWVQLIVDNNKRRTHTHTHT